MRGLRWRLLSPARGHVAEAVQGVERFTRFSTRRESAIFSAAWYMDDLRFGR